MPAVNMHGNFTAMYARSLVLPDHSFFLFGPRGTGKTTWLRHVLPGALWKNLLLDEDYLPLVGDRSSLRAQVDALPAGSWVVIDEVQRIPALLNEVHDLMARHGVRYKFAMSVSSARKLRRLDVNLLAGRAIERKMFPFSSAELGKDFDLSRALTHGMLPPVVQRRDYAVDILTAYVGTYLKQEIQQEALVEDVGSFHRFLKIAGIMNGEVINVSSVARDAAVARSTVERYFEVLVDTLVGFRLPGWQPRLKVRERTTPKFYLFDTGVARALTGRIHDPLTDLEVGKLLETFILHELRAAMEHQGSGGELCYWRSSGGLEVDFVWTRGDKGVAVEVKAAAKWHDGDGRALKELASSGRVGRSYGVYRGRQALKHGGILVLPSSQFLERLHSGDVLG